MSLPVLAEEVARSSRTLDELYFVLELCAREHGLAAEDEAALCTMAEAAFSTRR